MVQPLKDIQVLLVEDELDISVLLTDWLEALQVLNAQCPQLLVCDLRLPDLEDVTAVAVTSSSRENSAAAFSAGFDYWLAQPIEPEPLVEAVLGLIV